MRLLPALLAVGLLAPSALLSWAEEPSQVEFVRGLRTRYGPRLAEEYLRRLEQQHRLDSDPQLRLELARTRLELATTENNLTERIRLYQEAQAQVDQVLRSRPRSEIAAEAHDVETAVAAIEGEAPDVVPVAG